LRERFGIPIRLRFYEVPELEKIVTRAAGLLDLDLTEDGALEIAKRSRGTPRVAVRLLRRVRDFATVAGAERIDAIEADAALNRLEVDQRGLDAMDRRYLNCIARDFEGGPVGVDTIAASLSEQRDAIEDIIEPYLIQQALLQRTPRGRVLTRQGYEHLGMVAPKAKQAQIEMLPLEDGAEDSGDV
jgi:Holliday junction DNA helicase RuvB